MKAKRSLLNLIFGVTSQLIIIALGIFIPRLYLVNFGSEVNGLVSSIGQLMIYVSLLEAGVGTASIQALYKPVSENDKSSINEILAATSKYYKKTGIMYFAVVIILSLIYPIIVDTSVDKLTIMLVILFIGMSSAINYYFQGKYTVLLTAEGKNYIVASITTIINIVTNLVKIVLLLLGYNIIIVQAAHLILTIVQIIIYKIYIRKNYDWLDLHVKENFKAISQKHSVLIHQFSGLIFNNTDVLILTVFTDLKVVSVYVIYNMIFSNIDTIIYTINNSVTFALGHLYHENKEKFKKLIDIFEVYFLVIVFILFTITYILILPFMNLYTAGVKDINYINSYLPVLFVVIKLLTHARTAGLNVINIAGHFKKTQTRSILESFINIICSIIFVIKFGIYGVLLGTLIAVIYRTTDIIIYTNKNILRKNPWITLKRLSVNAVCFLVIVCMDNMVGFNASSYISLICYAIVLTMIITLIYISILPFYERRIFIYTARKSLAFLKAKVK